VNPARHLLARLAESDARTVEQLYMDQCRQLANMERHLYRLRGDLVAAVSVYARRAQETGNADLAEAIDTIRKACDATR
jgi:hypothetical protein